MISTLVQLPLWVEVVAVAVGSFQGAMYASRLHQRHVDLAGVLLIGVCTGVGGSLIRDILLSERSSALSNNWFLSTAVLAALAGMVLHRLIARIEPLVLVLDAVTVGTFAALGTSKALSVGVPSVPSLLVGALAAVGGSVLRDLLLDVPVAIVQVGLLYAAAATAGAVVLEVCLFGGASVSQAAAMCTITTTTVRLGAVRFGWTLPRAARSWRGAPPSA